MILTIAIIITILGLLYLVSPIDFVPDFFPVLGWVDDLIVIFIMGLVWITYFSVELFNIFSNGFFPILIVIVIVYMLVKLLNFFSKQKRRKK